jgi:regulator of protease activity HflC (stomatin/prohibitin superfamily)
MGLAVLSIMVIAAGAAVRFVAPGMKERAGAMRLLSYVIMLFGVGLAGLNAVVLVDVGEVGVKHFLGTANPQPLLQGVHVINPFASVEKMSIREQAFPRDGTIEKTQAKAGNRIEVLDVFVRDVQAPQRVRDAIEEKLQREQQVAAERFQTEIIQERARQQAEEAKGMAEAQGIITQGLTPEVSGLLLHSAVDPDAGGFGDLRPDRGGNPSDQEPRIRPVDPGHVPMIEDGNHGS